MATGIAQRRGKTNHQIYRVITIHLIEIATSKMSLNRALKSVMSL